MLTIEQLRAMPPAECETYLWQCLGRHDRQERDQPRWARQAEQARLDADAAERWAAKQREEWAETRAHLAAITAAGLWTLAVPSPSTPAPTGER